MSDFNDIFRKAVDGYEAPFDAGMWDKVSSQLSPMEDAFRESVKDYEAPYNPNAWAAIKNQIGSSSNLIQWIAGSAAGIGLVVGAIAFIPGNEEAPVEHVSRNAIQNTTPIVFNNEKPAEDNLAALITDSENNTETNNVNTPELVVAPSEAPGNEQNGQPNQNTPTVHIVDPNQGGNEVVNGGDVAPTEVEAVAEEVNEGIEDTQEIRYNADFSTSKSEICAGETILFNPKVLKQGVAYVWDFGDGNYSSEPAVSHTYSESGNYDVVLSLRNESTDKLLATATRNVLIKKLPDVDFSYEMNNQIIPTVDFINVSEETENWIWKINGKVTSDKNQFEYTFREKGDYKVELFAENSLGCQNQSQKQITIENNYNLLAPTAFSPNGDINNENFIPVALKMMDCEFTMTVFNQAGKRVFQTVSASSPWDGSDMTDNSMAPAGAYIWIVSLKNGNGTYENYKGQVFLTR